MPEPDRRIPKLIFLTVLCIGLFTMQGKVRDSDAYPMVLTTQAICERGTLAIENLNAEDNPVADDWANMKVYWAHTEEHQYGGRNDSGELFSKYGIMASVVFIPLWYIGMLLASLFGLEGASRLSFIVFIAGITIPLLLALCGVLLYRISRTFDFTPRTATFLALALALCSNLLVYGGMYMSEVTQVTFMLLGWHFIFGFILKKKPVWWALAGGFAYSLMMLTKFADVIYTLPLLFIVAVKMGGAIVDGFRRFSKGLPIPAVEYRRNAYGIGAVLAGLIIFPVAFYLFNYARFGNPLTTGYGAEDQFEFLPFKYFYAGLAGFLISPGKSLFLYFPPVVLFFWAFRRFRGKFPAVMIFFILHALTQLLFYMPFIYWSGFWSWGPRYSLLILPALLIPVGVLLEGDGAKRYLTAFRRLCYAGFIIQFPVLIIHFNEFIRLMRNTFGEAITTGCYIKMYFIPIFSPVLCNWWLLISKLFHTIFGVGIPIWGMNTEGYTATKLFFITLSRDIPSLAPVFIILAVGFLLGAIVIGLRLKDLLRSS